MTDIQHRILEIVARRLATGRPPSVREIARACRIPRSTVQRHLDAMEAEGLISRDPAQARSVRVSGTNVPPKLLTGADGKR